MSCQLRRSRYNHRGDAHIGEASHPGPWPFSGSGSGSGDTSGHVREDREAKATTAEEAPTCGEAQLSDDDDLQAGVGYASQSAKALTFSLLDVGCGIISTHNALALLRMPIHLSVIAGAFLMVKQGGLRTGLSPVKLHACIELLLAHAQLDCGTRLVEPASVGMLQPGTLIYVRSSLMCHFALPNVFGPPEDPFAPEEPESHIVMVEDVGDNMVTVINPDTSTQGGDQQWGRFTFTWGQLHQVWHTTRHDGSTTDRVAIILEPSSAPSA